MMKEARILADNGDLKMALFYLRRAEKMLENVNIDDAVIHILKDEVQELLRLMQWHEIYGGIGRLLFCSFYFPKLCSILPSNLLVSCFVEILCLSRRS